MKSNKSNRLERTAHFEACKRFLTQPDETADSVAKYLQGLGYRWVTRERVYPLIREGVREGLVRLCPPEDQELAEQLRLKLHADVAVVAVRGENVNDYLAHEAAKKIVTLIKLLSRSKSVVRVGIGGGLTTEKVCRELARLLEAEPANELPTLYFHSVSVGYDPNLPESNPIMFFSYFKALQRGDKIKFVGLFCPARISVDNYANLKKEDDLAEVFAQSRKIDIVFTSFASSEDKHSQFKNLSSANTNVTLDHLKEQKWVGDVQLRPYNAHGPITLERGLRTATLFELEDLRSMAEDPHKHVILIAGPCNYCKKSKALALRPLLDVPELRVFNHLIIDAETAKEVLALSPLRRVAAK